MTATESEAVAINDERDEEIIRLRIAGASVRAIAKQLGCTAGDVNRAVDRLANTILDVRYRTRTVALELERFDRLGMRFFAMALNGDVAAGSLLVKISERRGDLLGLNSPIKVDVIDAQRQAQPVATSTDRITAALDRIAGKLPKPEG
jgi:hypothetical protein